MNAAIECVAFVAALFFSCGRRWPLVFLTAFLGYTLLNEMAAEYWYQVLGKPSNYVFYTVYTPLSLLFYGWLVCLGIRSRGRRLACRAAMAAGVVFAIANAVWWQGPVAYNTYSIMVTMMLTLFIVLLRFYDLVAGETARLSTPAEPYILAGLMIFNCCALVTMALYPTIRDSGLQWNGQPLSSIVLWCINALQYGLFILGLWKCRTHHNNNERPSYWSS